MATKLAKDWLKASLSDLMNIEAILGNDFLTHIVAFHSQQAVEKSLKAMIENRKERIPKVHSLRKLIEMMDESIEYDLELIKLLDSLYIESRYPTDMGLLPYGKPTVEDSREFYEFALKVFEDVCLKLEVDKGELMR
ncbi:HEPN domain-containing protein [Sulfurovum sp. bin170]|uniref:HEPN domain-containing protein n=1 Tax=Sulfurovum sp. bin170 TaxID=2695268 RepID=UPI0013DFD53E|nr:HEPN domain-containing protein [Sulfurovum sp. bin170]NEW60913.1 HEPN domain-containing protein [Sulfurovum sp. bin170]